MWIIRFFLWISTLIGTSDDLFRVRVAIYFYLPRLAGPKGLKESAKGESPTAPLVMEMARAVIGQKEGDTSIITPNLDSVSVRRAVTS
jgi:hypothetical protein